MERSDASLVSDSHDGDREAYAVLVHRHLRRVFAICLSMLGEVADAEDAAQEIFVRGFEKVDGLRDGERFASWIDQIARNRCRDLLRRRQRRAERPLTSEVEASTAAPGDDHAELRHALTRLPEEHRTPLLLYYFDGKNVRTLAKELGLSEGGACSRLFRARHRLRMLLAEEATTNE
jgi:RNA polymerase sigma-70 factor (ECF subfamily)